MENFPGGPVVKTVLPVKGALVQDTVRADPHAVQGAGPARAGGEVRRPGPTVNPSREQRKWLSVQVSECYPAGLQAEYKVILR